MKPTAPAFRQKRDHKNVETKEHVKNLTPYLDNDRSSKNLTLDVLNNALHGLAPAMVPDADVFGYQTAFNWIHCILLVSRESTMFLRSCSWNFYWQIAHFISKEKVILNVFFQNPQKYLSQTQNIFNEKYNYTVQLLQKYYSLSEQVQRLLRTVKSTLKGESLKY